MSRVLDLWSGMTGALQDFAGDTAPPGWLMCYGQEVSRTAYAVLFGVIGTKYGAGNGSTTFNVPDCRGRASVGKDDMGGTAANRLTAAGGIDGKTLGASGGTEVHTLTSAQMPQHNHAVTDPGHSHGITDPGHTHTVTDPGHNHNINANYYGLSASGFGTATPYCGGGQFISTANVAAGTGISIQARATGITAGSAASGVSTQNAGTGAAHPNVQPGIIFNKIIKA